jgi:spoIIIJ-associated protein
MSDTKNPTDGLTSVAPEDADRGIEASIMYAKKYMEDLLSFFGLNTDVYATNSDDQVIELHVPSTHLNAFLIGHNGDTLRSLQFLVSSALKNNGFILSRVSVDIADYKKARADRLSDKAKAWLEEVKKTGQDKPLEPMNAADRRTIHQLASEYGLSTESQGEGRERHIVIKALSSTEE